MHYACTKDRKRNHGFFLADYKTSVGALPNSQHGILIYSDH